MSRLYYLSDVSSDLTGGADFSYALYPNPTSASRSSSAITVNIAAGSAESSLGFSEINSPGIKGTTGNYTIALNVSTANTNISCDVRVHRINSSNAIQTSSGFAGNQSLGTTGIKTYSLTNIDLGTWASTDRLRVEYLFTNAANHQANSVAILANDNNTYILTPFTVRNFATL